MHIEEGTSPEGSASTISQEACVLLESSIIILGQINTHQGEYHNREFDTRIKEKPTKCDIENVNQALQELMKQQNVFPADNPFCYLWITNWCFILLLLLFFCTKDGKVYECTRKKWRKLERRSRSLKQKWNVCSKTEMLTKRGKRNRAILRKECHTISMSSLVGYMERQKSLLRKLKKGFVREKKQEEARSIGSSRLMLVGCVQA